MIPLGCQPYLATKVQGEISMSEKAGCIKTIKMLARRDPDGMVKAGLPEPQWPNCKQLGSDTMVDIRCPQDRQCCATTDHVERVPPRSLHAPGDKVGIANLKDTNGAPATVLNVVRARNARSPKGGDPHGDGAPIVVRGQCAASRHERSPGNPGEVERNTSGSSNLPDDERQRGQQHVRNGENQ